MSKRKPTGPQLLEAHVQANGYGYIIELAGKLDVSRATINAWRTGVSRPSYQHRKALAELLDIPAESWGAA